MADTDEQHVQDIMHTVLGMPGATMPGTDMTGPSVGGGMGSSQALTPMTDSQLLALVGQKIASSHQWYGTGKLASQRIQADQYYRGEPLGNEQDGRSQVVSRDVAEAVDSLMPSLMRIFASGEEVVVMEPSRPDAEEAAKQATDYLNWEFLQQNSGFDVLYTWFKDALLKRNGIVAAWYETRTTRQKDTYHGLTEQQWQAVTQDPSVKVLQTEQYADESQPPQPMINPMTGQPAIDPHTGQPMMQPPQMLYDCTIMAAKPVKKLIVENVPPDEFIIERRAVSLSKANYMGRRREETISDLIELGYDRDLVLSIPSGDDHEYTQERIERFAEEDQLPYGTEGDSLDPTMRKVWITQSYFRVDYDGDGVAEWRKVTTAGDSALAGTIILDNEEIDDHPFASLTPKPDPHRFYGFSLYDETSDIQEINTALMRGALDSIYLGNSQRIGAVEGQVNFDDLLDSRVGGVVRLKNPNALVPIPSINVAPDAFNMMDRMNAMREKRTGISVQAAGVDPNILNSSATGASILNNNQQQRAELIARVFAETGVKRLFRRIFELTCLHQDKAKTVRLRGKWVDIDPTDWKGRMDVTVSVGVGLGNRQEKMQTAMMMLNLDEKIVSLQQGIQGPLLTGKHIYNKLAKVVEAAGWKSVEPYYQDPDTAPPVPPKPPSPQEQIEQVRLQIEQLKVTNEQHSLAVESQGDQIEAQTELAKAKMDNETKIAIAYIQAHADVQSSIAGKQNVTVSKDGQMMQEPPTSALMDTVNQQLQQTFAGMQQQIDLLKNSHTQLAQSNADLAHAVTKPKKVLTDAEGNITGVE